MKIPQMLLNACIELIGFIELLIGVATILFVTLFSIFSIVEKPLNIFFFVIISAFISTYIGYGILNFKDSTRILLIFFSGYVILLKIMIYLGILHFTGEILTTPPPFIKNLISVLYHIFLILFFTHKGVITAFNSGKKSSHYR